jgi:type II secretory pathway component PulK
MNMRRNNAGGFVLVVVLVALVVITLLASAVAVVSERAVREVQADVDAFEVEVDGIGTRDTVLYLLATQRQTYAGLTVDQQQVTVAGQAVVAGGSGEEGDSFSPLPVGNEIRLDGSAYRGLGAVRFSLQDDAGRFSPDWSPPLNWPGFLAMLGVTGDQQGALQATLLDYQDPDALRRLGGAEAAEYRARDLPPPSNRTLVTPLELRRVLGWDEMLKGHGDAELASLLTASRTAALNVNTASAEALQTLPGVDAAAAARIVALREQAPYTLLWKFIQDFQLPVDEMAPIRLSAVGYGTLSLWHNAGGPVRLLHWTLTPSDEGGRPWRLDYEITLPRDKALDSSLARKTETPLLAGPVAAGK